MAEYDQFIESIASEIEQISENAGLPDGFLTLTDKQNGEKSLWIVEPLSKRKSRMIMSIAQRGRKDSRSISVTVKTARLSSLSIPENVEIRKDKKDESISYLSFVQSDEQILKCMYDLIRLYINQFEPSDKFGCCHRFKECSAEKQCVHPDQFYATACWYRKNLEAGKIFY